MLLWVIFAFLTAIAAVVVLLPLWRQKSAEDAPARDVEIYKQQLREVEGERASGLLGEEEAKAARIEISRRLIAATEAVERAERRVQRATAGLPVAAYAMVAVLVLISIGGYAIYGSPDLPAQPFASRTQQPNPMQAVIDRVEKQLKDHPDDGAGWSVAGTLYLRMGRFAEAVEAHGKALKILGENTERLANLGEAMAFANNGVVSPESRALFEKAVGMDAEEAKSNFWLAMADEQAGKTAEAVVRYKRMLAGNFPEEGKALLRKRLAALEAQPGGGTDTAPQGAAGAKGSVDQSAQQTAEQEMIASMVSRLAERLKKDGSDLKGWLMLVRAYTVLGRKDEAIKALSQARTNFNDNKEALGQIDALAQSLGLSS